VENIFAGFKIDWGGQSKFYSSTGTFVDFVGMIHSEKTFIPMLFEFGTLNSQSTFGSLKSLHNTILENQGTQYGFSHEEDRSRVENQFRHMFYPDSDSWKSSCCSEFRKVMDVALNNYLEFKGAAINN
jgi:hypothetical protein